MRTILTALLLAAATPALASMLPRSCPAYHLNACAMQYQRCVSSCWVWSCRNDCYQPYSGCSMHCPSSGAGQGRF